MIDARSTNLEMRIKNSLNFHRSAIGVKFWPKSQLTILKKNIWRS